MMSICHRWLGVRAVEKYRFGGVTGRFVRFLFCQAFFVTAPVASPTGWRASGITVAAGLISAADPTRERVFWATACYRTLIENSRPRTGLDLGIQPLGAVLAVSRAPALYRMGVGAELLSEQGS